MAFYVYTFDFITRFNLYYKYKTCFIRYLCCEMVINAVLFDILSDNSKY